MPDQHLCQPRHNHYTAKKEMMKMLLFVLGMIVGGVIGFGICAICSAAGTDNREESSGKKKGKRNVPK